MKIIKIYYEKYEIPLIEKFKNSKNQYTNQQGLVFTIKTKEHVGLGEAVLLNGFSNHTMQEMVWAAESLIESIQDNEEYSMEELLIMAEIHCSHTPPVQFAIDTALYDIESQKQGLPLSKFLNKEAFGCVDCSQTLLNPKNIITSDTVKIKIGAHSMKDDIGFLNKIDQEYPNVKMRLDANQCYSIEEFSLLYKNISHLNIDFLEEPIKNPNIKKIKHIKSLYPSLNYAIDESIYQNRNYEEWIKNNLISTMIIRPSILGSFRSFFSIIDLYQSHLQILVSSSLENSVGNMAIIHLASTLSRKSKHGLNIYSFYNQFFIPPSYKNHKIKLEHLVGLGFQYD